MSPAPTVEEVLAEPSGIPPEAVILWRSRIGTAVNAAWRNDPSTAGNRLLVLFGKRDDERVPQTPVASDSPENTLDDEGMHARAARLWKSAGTSNSVCDIRDYPLVGFRVVVVTNTRIGSKLNTALKRAAIHAALDNPPAELFD